MWAGVRAVLGWCRDVVDQARYDWGVFSDLRKQYRSYNPEDHLW
jgi:hypothetical protein